VSGDDMQKDAAREALYRVTLSDRFQKEVKHIRQGLGIPSGGFKSKEALLRWKKTPGNQLLMVFDIPEEVDSLLLQHKLQPSFESLMTAYVLTSDLLYDAPPDSFGCDVEGVYAVDPEGGGILENKWGAGQVPYARLYIPQSASLSSVQRYLKQHWPYISKEILGKKSNAKNIRRTRNAKRDNLIASYYQRSRSELGLKKGEYKDIAVARLLKEKDGYKKVSADIVRTVVHRRKLLRDN
jgi:hypothetical protein